MTDILLIDGQPERGTQTAAALHELGIVAHVQADTNLTNLAQVQCVIAMHDVIDSVLDDIASAVPLIVIAEQATIANAVACIRRGAADYLSLPVEPEALVAAVERATANSHKVQQNSLDQFQMIGSSELMKALKQGIAKAAPTDSTVLITGQTGTGKELVARALHASSRRSGSPLFSINCATVPDNLIEAELFGMEQFDAGLGVHRGLIEAADGGTLFIDEIAELPQAAQARLLRVLQGENRRVGSSTTVPVNVRLIAATHRNLDQLTQSDQFRADLYYRLNVVTFHIAPLSTRQQDILEIADWLLKKTSTRLNKNNLKFNTTARQAMLAYNWPGNVRELENAIERAVILCDPDTEITQSHLAIEPSPSTQTGAELQIPRETSLEDYFVRFVEDNQDHFTETELAEKLGISRKSLWERRQRLNIPRRKTKKRGPRHDATPL